MYKFLNLLLITLVINSCTSNDIVKNRILVIVEYKLSEKISEEIVQFQKDLENDGYTVIINNKDFTSDSEPVNIREYIKSVNDDYSDLSGSIIIGNIPVPLYNIKRDLGDAYWHNYLVDFFYMDLDGVWLDINNDGILDQHQQTDYEVINKVRSKLGLDDIRKPEIWVSRIRSDKLTSLGEEADLMKQYFNKNHKYRTKNMKLPPKRAFAVSAGVNFKKSEWGAYPEKLYSDIDHEYYHDSLGYTLRKFLSSKEGYEFGIINVFSGPRVHHFSHFFNEINEEWWKTKEGRSKIAEYSDKINDSNDVSWNDIKKIKPNILFYHLLTSEVGRHDFQDYLGGMYLFSGQGLTIIAGTQHSGSIGIPLLYDKLKEGNTFGESWQKSLEWLVDNSMKKISIFYYPDNEQKINAGKSNYKAVLLGDGTLKLPDQY